MNGFLLCISVIIIGILVFIYSRDKESKVDTSLFSYKHVTEESYQNYAKFYDAIIPKDGEFINKIETVYNLINSKEYNIKKISDKSNCTLEETLLMIGYLKNKRLLGNLYIDTTSYELLPCSNEDERLLDKYDDYIYESHLQINEIANQIPNKGYKDVEELRDEVFNELVYLDKKGLLNGIKINTVDKKLVYYTIEKKKKHDYETVHCPNCGALNDVDSDSKVRCGYCNGIIKGTKFDENN